MSGEKEEKFTQDWEMTRSKGMFKHSIKLAAVWGLPMFLIMTFVFPPPSKSVLATNTYDTRMIITNFIIYTVTGFLMGLWIWHRNESKYKKIKGINSEEKYKTISFSEELKLNSNMACEAAIMHTWIFSAISALVGTVMGLSGLFIENINVSPVVNYLAHPLALFDAALLFVLTFYIYKKSRVAVTILLIHFMLGKLTEYATVGFGWGLGFTLLLLFVYLNGARAMYIWHSKYKNL